MNYGVELGSAELIEQLMCLETWLQLLGGLIELLEQQREIDLAH